MLLAHKSVQDTEKKFKCPAGWELEPTAVTAAFQGKASEVELERIVAGAKLEKSEKEYKLSLPSGSSRDPRTWYYLCKGKKVSQESGEGKHPSRAGAGSDGSMSDSQPVNVLSGSEESHSGMAIDSAHTPSLNQGPQLSPAGPGPQPAGAAQHDDSDSLTPDQGLTSGHNAGAGVQQHSSPGGVSAGSGPSHEEDGLKGSDAPGQSAGVLAGSVDAGEGLGLSEKEDPSLKGDKEPHTPADVADPDHRQAEQNAKARSPGALAEHVEERTLEKTQGTVRRLAQLGDLTGSNTSFSNALLKTAFRASAKPETDSATHETDSAEPALETCKVMVQVLPSTVIECNAGETKAATVSAVGSPVAFKCGAGLSLESTALDKVYDDKDGKCASQVALSSLVDGSLSVVSPEKETEAEPKKYFFGVDVLPTEQQALCYKCVETSSSEKEASGGAADAGKECQVKITVASPAVSAAPGAVSFACVALFGAVAGGLFW
ncbi:hypothetical protein BESB_081980 [Besnoitia besnoiti]|uniref:SRS domain-containing protein n=1 Tax=Besnoitia besnoiti TaxID=94643 RepID=A0A2A9M4X2_BESBE|nr:hypothetical protein BESB_081980 [Besnoitia besnoiti]PFH32999.1 hypothetical protein BESB_081980 [Besnoitia besnoiti]